jgi:hypothetical protein
MASAIENAKRTFKASGAIPAHTLVKLVAGTADLVEVCTAGNGALAIGVAEDPIADTKYGTIRLLNAGGTVKVRVGEAIDLFDPLFCATAGEVKDTEDGNCVGIAMETASGNDSLIEMLILPAAGRASLQGVAGVGGKIAFGATALDGSNPTPVVTGLGTITAFVAMLQGSSAPGVGTSILTVTISSGTASVYAWKVTGAGDTTLIASTGTETFQWIAAGV